jgi:uncharacterized protein YndB with AHSA1/START domain
MSTTTQQPGARATITTPADREIRIERIFNAPRSRVWRAFTDPDQLKQWWGRGNDLEIVRMEVEPGGHWRYIEHTPDGDHGFEGRYGEIVPEERIVMTFEWDGMPTHLSLETVEFEDLGDGRTRVINTSLFLTTEDRDGMLQSGLEEGLNQSYAALDRLLAAQSR